MNAELKALLARVPQWPGKDQDELLMAARDIEARLHRTYDASVNELQSIDEALESVAVGLIATEEEVDATISRYRPRVRYSKLALAELYATLGMKAVKNASPFEELAARLQSVIEQVREFSELGQEVSQRPGVRRVPILRCPLIVYYKIVDGETIILRLLRIAQPRIGVKI